MSKMKEKQQLLRCSACKKELPTKNFSKSTHEVARGYTYWCHACKRTKNQQGRETRRVKAAGQKIVELEIVSEIPRSFSMALLTLIKYQLRLLYPKGDGAISEIRRLGIISDTVEEIKQALSRANNRMRTLYGNDNAALLQDLRHQVQIATAYETLEIEADATDDHVKSRFLEKVKEHHPDFGGDSDEMARINLAYERIMKERQHGTEKTLCV